MVKTIQRGGHQIKLIQPGIGALDVDAVTEKNLA